MSDRAFVNLRKGPFLRGGRCIADEPDTVMRGSLRDRIKVLRHKPEATHHLYETRFADDTVLSCGDTLALMRRRGKKRP